MGPSALGLMMAWESTCWALMARKAKRVLDNILSVFFLRELQSLEVSGRRKRSRKRECGNECMNEEVSDVMMRWWDYERARWDYLYSWERLGKKAITSA